LADDIVESGVLGLTVVVNHDRASLCEYEIVCGMGRSVTQAVLWLSSTHKPKGVLAPPAVDTEYRNHEKGVCRS
jgi:hypothetical protein